ncbi:hypothetical protein HCN44_008026 [Aphidius gifuensis]|uniref:Uncharacterized protein n=1 Tax=Aphidius gifuensis TaxID=684658 RepID=A0A834XM09_APHGI|nr:hypothetical protein HCN44_008026 [Aphidius gifuensis]
MSEIVKIPLRLVKTTYYITTQNTTKFLLQSICHMENACSQIIKNLIASAQKISAGCWKIIKIYPVPLTFIVINIPIIYCAYNITTNHELRERINMLITARKETSKYSIVPSKTITSSVLFDDSRIRIFTKEGNRLVVNDNTRNLILSKELDENIEKPFPRGEPIPVKFDRYNGLLDNGKLTLEDCDKTLTFHHTLSLEVKKTSTTLQDEIAAMEKEPSKIQQTKIIKSNILIPDKHFYDRIVAKEKEPSKIQQTKISKFNVLVPDNELSLKISKDEYKWPDITVDRSNPVYSDIFPTTENFSFSFHTIIKIQADDSDEVFYFKQNVNFEYDRKLDENLQNIIDTEELSTEDISSKATWVKFDSGVVVFKTQDGEKILINDNTRNLILSEELNANIEEPFPRGEPIPIKFDRFNGLLDNGKLTLKTEDGNTTFTYHHTLSLEVKKTSTTLQDEIAAMEKKTFEQMKLGRFNALIPRRKVTLKTSEGEYELPSNSPSKFRDAFPIIGSFIFSVDETVKIQADESDEVYHLKHNVKIECDKKVDENLQNIMATKEVSLLDMIPGGTYPTFDCGTVVFKTQDGEKVMVRKKMDFIIVENGPKTETLNERPQIALNYI